LVGILERLWRASGLLNQSAVIAPLSALSPVLVVEPDHVDRVLVHSALAMAGFDVTTTNNYEDAHAVLVARPPLVLVTTIRLGAYNGLHLALRGRDENPRMVIAVTSSVPDAVLQRDAEQIGATFILKPVTAADLLAAIHRTALRLPGPDGSLEPVRPPFERRRTDRRVSQALGLAAERRYAERRRDLAGVLLQAAAEV
jgi:DNA-binding NtrC family response regulator